MGDIENLQVQLNKSVYKPGETVSGSVNFKTAEDKNFNRIAIQFLGEAHVSWVTPTQNTPKTYKSSEVYFNSEIHLFGKQSNDDKEKPILKAGSHTFPFTFVLPLTCESSFKGVHCGISYSCTATISIPRSLDKISQVYFNVVRPVDLNECTVDSPGKTESQVDAGCLIFNSGKIKCSMSIHKRGFVVGEQIPIQLDVSNGSSSAVDSYEAKLIQKTKLRAKSGRKELEKEVFSVKGTETFAANLSKIKTLVMQVPNTVATMSTSAIISVEYEIGFSLTPGMCSTELKLTQPIVIGTVPVHVGAQPHTAMGSEVVDQVIEQQPLGQHQIQNPPVEVPSNPPNQSMPLPGSMASPAISNTNEPPGLPPPSYEEAYV